MVFFVHNPVVLVILVANMVCRVLAAEAFRFDRVSANQIVIDFW